MTVLVTGGAGFIGSHLVNALLSMNFRVAILDNLSTGKRVRIKSSVVFYEGDIRNREFVTEVVEKEQPEVIFHTLGEEAHKRALNLFTIERSLGLYLKSYQTLLRSAEQPQIIFFQLQRQKLLVNKGYAFLELGYWDEAITHFQQAIDINSTSLAVPMLLNEIAFANFKLGKVERTHKDLARAQTLVNKNTDQDTEHAQVIFIQLQRQRSYANKGYALMELQYWNEAISQFQKAIDADSTSLAVPVLLTEIAFAYNELGESKRAYQDLATYKSLTNKNEAHRIEQQQANHRQLQRQSLLANKGYTLMELNYWHEAIVLFRKAVVAYPNSTAVPVLMTEIALAYNELGETDRANNELVKAKVLESLIHEHSIA